MSRKNTTEVIIDGKIYTIGGYESEEYLQKVAAYINGKLMEFRRNDAFRRHSSDMLHTLMDINIADDYFKAKKQADQLEADMESKEKQLYDLMSDLNSTQVLLEAAQREIANMQQEIVDYQKEIIRFETEMKERERRKGSKGQNEDKTEGD